MRRQKGLTLIEVIMFIVIVGVGIAGILTVMDYTSGRSADPMIRKQEIAIAQSLLEEIELKPYTYCDPDDAQFDTATSATIGAAGCATLIEAMGPEAGETRYAPPQFDNVNDYNGFTMSGGILDATGTPIGGLNNYSVAVAVVPEALGGVAATESLRITVTVTGPDKSSVALDGYRTRYAPRT